MFSPLAFPAGSVIYDLSTSFPPPSHLALAPFELYREPLIVIGIADHASIEAPLGHETEISVKGGVSNLVRADSRDLVDVLSPVLGELQVEFPRALVHELLIFDQNDSSIQFPDGMIAVPSLESSKTTTMKTVMCDLTSHLLAEMTTYAKSLQALPMIESPRQGSSPATPNGHASGLAAKMGFLAETSPQPFLEGQHGRTLSRTTIPSHMAMESRSGAFKLENRSAASSDGTRTPPTTFDEIAVGSMNTSAIYSSTPDIKRPRSQDKVSMHGFGAGSFGERERNKGKGRVGIIIGSIYLLAGRWPDALRELTENAIIAKTHNDHIWHAKALDYLIICLLMHAWAGIDFRVSIQQICFSNFSVGVYFDSY
jgi:trafficking protein particle complex subunit 9